MNKFADEYYPIMLSGIGNGITVQAVLEWLDENLSAGPNGVTGKRIDPNDIRKGDRYRVEFEVESAPPITLRYSEQEPRTEMRKHTMERVSDGRDPRPAKYSFQTLSNVKFFLLERPETKPTLPTVPGALVKMRKHHQWARTADGAWISTDGSILDQDMAQQIADEYGFEVLNDGVKVGDES